METFTIILAGLVGLSRYGFDYFMAAPLWGQILIALIAAWLLLGLAFRLWLIYARLSILYRQWRYY